MGLLLLRKGSQSYIGLVFNPFDPPTRVVIVKRKCVRLHANTRFGGGGGGGPAPRTPPAPPDRPQDLPLELTEVYIIKAVFICVPEH